MALKKTQEDFRQKIDSLDNEILSALLKRQVLIKDYLAQHPNPGSSFLYAPDREAALIRSLLKQNKHVFPDRVLVNIFREIISASQQLNPPFNIAVYSDIQHNLMDLAKEYFGGVATYYACSSISQTFHLLDTKESDVAVLPVFDQIDIPWWTTLFSSEHQSLKIIARLPFLLENSKQLKAEGYIISTAVSEPTGSDRSLFGIELVQQASMGALKSWFTEKGFVVNHLWTNSPLSGVYLSAIELEGFVEQNDERLLLLQAQHADVIKVIQRIGGYAVQERE